MNKNKTTYLLITIILIIIIGIIAYIISKQNKENTNNQTNQLENTVEKQIIKEEKKEETTKIDTKYTEISKELDKDEVLSIREVEKQNESYILKGIIYTKETLSKEELETAAKKGVYKYKDETYKIKKDDKEYGVDYAFYKEYKDEIRLTYIATKKDEKTYYIENTTECPDEWKNTNQYKYILVDRNIKVENDEENSTVEKTLKIGKNDESSIAYTFEFKNGKCTKVIENILGH